jgi:hypothetical protein
LTNFHSQIYLIYKKITKVIEMERITNNRIKIMERSLQKQKNLIYMKSNILVDNIDRFSLLIRFYFGSDI